MAEDKKLKIISDYSLKGDQPEALGALIKNINQGKKYQVLLGVTGSGKTFTIANLIQELNLPTLVISHNKTLAAQLYQEFRDFFPQNAVSYFVSYYDYYQPEAYIPSTDTYIEKDADINELIDKLRLAATANILSRHDIVTIASVSCIYNIGSPTDYSNMVLTLKEGMEITRKKIAEQLADLQYDRGEFEFHRGTFRIVGDGIDIYPAYEDIGIRLLLTGDVLTSISAIDPVSGATVNPSLKIYAVYPAKHFMTNKVKQKEITNKIRLDLADQLNKFKKEGKLLEAQRLEQRVTYDLEMIEEVGYVKGIENYSRYFDGRSPGDPPFSLIDYYNHQYGDNWLLVVDESHMTFPQIRGMFAGDLSRKQTLINYGFRLPASLDNRPLRFDEFLRSIPNFIAVSATPDPWEVSMADGEVVQQLIRPTGIPDPVVEIRPAKNEVIDVTKEIIANSKKGERTLVTTLTKRTAEDLTAYLSDKGLKVHYIHSDVKTLERSDIIEDLRLGNYDCLVGINLLREGLDLPEVSLVAILDADKEGFLRSRVSLIQTMGRAARHPQGKVILYADRRTDSMNTALEEVERRREVQIAWNLKHNITPTHIIKPVRQRVIEAEVNDVLASDSKLPLGMSFEVLESDNLTGYDKKKLIKRLTREMRLAAGDLNFELAAAIRDKVKELEK